MLREVTWPDLVRWKKHYDREPLGMRRQEWQFASVCSTLANLLTSRGEGDQRFVPSDFLLKFKPESEVVKVKQETPEQRVQRLKFIARQQVALANAEEKARLKKIEKRERMQREAAARKANTKRR